MHLLAKIKHHFQERRASQQRENATDRAARSTARATWAIAVLTLVVVTLGVLQWRTLDNTDKTLSLQLRAAMADQRPFVTVTNSIGSPKLLPRDGTAYLVWNWEMKNFGRGIAYRFRYEDYLRFGNDAIFRPAHQGKSSAGMPSGLPPGRVAFASAISYRPLFESELKTFIESKLEVGLLLEFEYFDIYDQRYNEAVCIQVLNSGAIGHINPEECHKDKKDSR